MKNSKELFGGDKKAGHSLFSHPENSLKISVTDLKNQYSVIQWELLDWPELEEDETIRGIAGFWRVEKKAQNMSLVQYPVYTDPGPIPFDLWWIVDIMSKNSVPEAFLQTKSRTEEINKGGLNENKT